jgi:hypothetical protein
MNSFDTFELRLLPDEYKLLKAQVQFLVDGNLGTNGTKYALVIETDKDYLTF